MWAAIAEVTALKSRSIGHTAGGELEPQDLLRLCGDNPAAGCRVEGRPGLENPDCIRISRKSQDSGYGERSIAMVDARR